TKDFSVADGYGVHDYPALVYFESGIPNVFEVPPQRKGNKQPAYCRTYCSPMPSDANYRNSSFSSNNNHKSKQFLKNYISRKRKRIESQGLELIDDECDVFGIHMVKIQDPTISETNGNPLLFEGDLQNEQSVLEWLIDDDNREWADEIEEVNERMLERLMAESTLLVVFFYDEDCAECEKSWRNWKKSMVRLICLALIFVKIASVEAAKKKQVPVLYDGDLHQHDKIITWLTSQDVFEIKNEIEEVNRKMLDKLLEENEFINEHNQQESLAALEKLENIDSETDNLDITFVKMADSRYAKKWGVTKLPAMVYFRRRFPSIYRGDLLSEDEVLEWLRKNRFRQPELNIFMYALIALSVAFILYTAFLLQCFKPAPPPPPQHPKQS
ncbi:hypothetical protein DOY81_002931, partial [Sarcophaga bullata]